MPQRTVSSVKTLNTMTTIMTVIVRERGKIPLREAGGSAGGGKWEDIGGRKITLMKCSVPLTETKI